MVHTPQQTEPGPSEHGGSWCQQSSATQLDALGSASSVFHFHLSQEADGKPEENDAPF